MNTRGNTMYSGMARFLQTVPSPICRFWISVLSRATCAPLAAVMVSTRTSCSSMDLMGVTLSTTVTSPVKGALREQLVLLRRPRIVNAGMVDTLADFTFSSRSGRISKSTGAGGGRSAQGTSTTKSTSASSGFAMKPVRTSVAVTP